MTTTERAPTRRKPTAIRRREIAVAACTIVGRDGVTSLSTASLAREVGLSTGALFRHFASMDHIWEEVVRYAAERLDATYPAADLPPAARLRAVVEARIALLSREPGIAWLIRSPQAHHTLPGPAVEALKDVVQRSRVFLLEAIREGIAVGAFRGDLPPQVLLVPFTATVHALVGQPSIHDEAASPCSPAGGQILDGLFQLIAAPSPASVGGSDV